MGADFLDSPKFTISQLEHDLGRKMQAHEAIAPGPVDAHLDRIADCEAVAGGQAVEDFPALDARFQDGVTGDAAVVALLTAGEGVADGLGHRDVVAGGAAGRQLRLVGIAPEDFSVMG